MLLLIDALLSEPPSSITLFRDITLFARVFKGKDVLLECDIAERDLYWHWLKRHGAFDFIDDIVEYDVESGLTIRLKSQPGPANLKVRRIGYYNFNKIISNIN